MHMLEHLPTLSCNKVNVGHDIMTSLFIYLINQSILVIIISILWCIHTSDHPEEELAKFGYSLSEESWKI